MKDNVTKKLTGVMTPILTPFNNNLSIASDLFIDHARWLLEQGMHYICPFGTTGEALSLTVDERMSAVDSLIKGGIDPAVLIPGAGLCNLEETTKLCRHAIERGCKAVLTLPPFYYTKASDEGLYVYFARLIEIVNAAELKICLYHFPPLVGIGFSPDLTARLAQDFPNVFVAYKDTSGDFENTTAIINAAPSVAVFPGSEYPLAEGLRNGAMGCISATCNVNGAAIRHVFDVGMGAAQDDIDVINNKMITFRKIIERYGPIPAMKGLLAVKRKDERWSNVRPPFLPQGQSSTKKLIEELGTTLHL